MRMMQKCESSRVSDRLTVIRRLTLNRAMQQTSTKAQSTVERLTDVSRYTGAHKQRFDETGKGKGLAGRKDLPDASGYVHGYQNKDTYSKSH